MKKAYLYLLAAAAVLGPAATVQAQQAAQMLETASANMPSSIQERIARFEQRRENAHERRQQWQERVELAEERLAMRENRRGQQQQMRPTRSGQRNNTQQSRQGARDIRAVQGGVDARQEHLRGMIQQHRTPQQGQDMQHRDRGVAPQQRPASGRDSMTGQVRLANPRGIPSQGLDVPQNVRKRTGGSGDDVRQRALQNTRAASRDNHGSAAVRQPHRR